MAELSHHPRLCPLSRWACTVLLLLLSFCAPPAEALDPILSFSNFRGLPAYRNLAYSPDGAVLVFHVRGRKLEVHDADSGALVQTLTGHTNDIVAIDFTADGAMLVSGDEDGLVLVWSKSNGTWYKALSWTTSLPVRALSTSPDSERLVTAAGLTGSVVLEQRNLTTGVLLYQVVVGEDVYALQYNPNPSLGRPLLAVVGAMAAVNLTDADTGITVAQLPGPPASVYTVSWSPDGSQLVTGTDNDAMRVLLWTTTSMWNNTNETQPTVLQGHTQQVISSAFSPEGDRFVTGSYDTTARVWTAQGVLQQPFLLDTSLPTVLAVRKGGHQVAVAELSGAVHVWSIAPVDCALAEWGGWGNCSATCGNATQSRTRGVTLPSRFGGLACNATEEVAACNLPDCNSPSPWPSPASDSPSPVSDSTSPSPVSDTPSPSPVSGSPSPVSASESPSPSLSQSPSHSRSPRPSPSLSRSPSVSRSPAASPSPSSSLSPSPSTSPSASPVSATPSPSASLSPSTSPPASPSTSPSPPASPSPSPSPMALLVRSTSITTGDSERTSQFIQSQIGTLTQTTGMSAADRQAMAAAITLTTTYRYTDADQSYVQTSQPFAMARPGQTYTASVTSWGPGVTKAVVSTWDAANVSFTKLGITHANVPQASQLLLVVIDRMDDTGALQNSQPMQITLQTGGAPLALDGLFFTSSQVDGTNLLSAGANITQTATGYVITLPHTSAVNLFTGSTSSSSDSNTALYGLLALLVIPVGLALLLAIWRWRRRRATQTEPIKAFHEATERDAEPLLWDNRLHAVAHRLEPSPHHEEPELAADDAMSLPDPELLMETITKRQTSVAFIDRRERSGSIVYIGARRGSEAAAADVPPARRHSSFSDKLRNLQPGTELVDLEAVRQQFSPASKQGIRAPMNTPHDVAKIP